MTRTRRTGREVPRHDQSDMAAVVPTVDIGILTIREDEFRAVLDAFPGGADNFKSVRTQRQ